MTKIRDSRTSKSKLTHDASWDLDEGEDGYSPSSDAAYNRKFLIWKRRNWIHWLNKNLSFPFMAKRTGEFDSIDIS